MSTEPEFSFLVNCNNVQETGKTFETEASVQECTALAKRFGLLSLERLKLKAFASRQSAEVVLLQCDFTANYVQKCVISLKPLKKNIDCTFERLYSSSFEQCFGQESEPQEEYIQNTEDAPDPPDPIINGFFNLGESVAEQLSLEIDPFPRSVGVYFDGFSSYQDDQDSVKRNSPFAALELLKKKT
jgi:uncharacterized metal-binding protein YceD (DUF177 family)